MGGPVLSMALIASMGTNKWELEDLVLAHWPLPPGFDSTFRMRTHLARNHLVQMTKKISKSENAAVLATNRFHISKFCIASGMTIKFFPLWLAELALSQFELNGVVAIQFVMIGVLAVGLKVVASRLGRMQVALLSRICGLAFLPTIVLGEPYFWDLK
jgi:hypothetical protein